MVFGWLVLPFIRLGGGLAKWLARKTARSPKFDKLWRLLTADKRDDVLQRGHWTVFRTLPVLRVSRQVDPRERRRCSIDRYLSRLHHLRNRNDDCRLLREMELVVRAWHWRVTFATAKSCHRSLPGRLPLA
jgi:hypothetical protein